jgi:hypothetical protein
MESNTLCVRREGKGREGNENEKKGRSRNVVNSLSISIHLKNKN